MRGKKSKGFIITKLESKEIRKKLIDMDLTQSDIAAELNLSVSSVSSIVCGTYSSLRVRNYLAKRLNIPELRIIPEELYLD